MVDNSKTDWQSWMTGLLALSTAYWAYIHYRPPLDSKRPPTTSFRQESVVGDQFVPARLWQDPVEAIENYNSSYTADSDRRLRQDKIECPDPSYSKVDAIGVFFDGQEYPEDVEVRLRQRYAVQSAMANCGFRPFDRSFLGGIKIPWGNSEPISESVVQAKLIRVNNSVSINVSQNDHSRGESPGDLIVPYEWFVDDTRNSAVAVLWLREEAFADKPLVRLGRLVGRIKLHPEGRFSVIGPRSSDTLERIYRDARGFKTNNYYTWPMNGLEIYSCEATAPDTRVMNTDLSPGPLGGRRSLEKSITDYTDNRVKLFNWIHTDDRLAESVMTELRKRGLNVGRANGRFTDRIVLVAESDTVYGRSLMATFTNVIAKEVGCQSDKDVLTITYLRGLDGSKPGPLKKERASDKQDLSQQTSGVSDERPERPSGDAQKDYALRLARRLQMNDFESRKNGEGRIRAIGVMGSDVFDKLILIQALRDRFPEAIFFTTDLDARLTAQDQKEWTRNLIIASSFGLSQTATKPPFRDSYQSAIYEACSQVITQTNNWDWDAVKPPKIYEVGRNTVVGLNVKDDEDGTVLHDLFWLTALLMVIGLGGLVHSCRPCGNYVHGLLDKILGVSERTGIANSEKKDDMPNLIDADEAKWQKVLGTLEKQKEEAIAQRTRWLIKMVLWGIAGLAVIYFWGRWLSLKGGEEPFYWLEGISVWPTELLRVAVLTLAIGWVMWVWWTHKIRLSQDCIDFRLQLRSPEPETYSRLKEQIKAFRERASLTRWEPEKLEMKEIYEDYQRKGFWWSRMWRIVPITLALFALSFGLIFLFDDFPLPSPVRGPISSSIDRFLFWSNAVAFFFVLSYVVDVTRFSERFITLMRKGGPTVWPISYLSEWKKKLHVSENILGYYLNVRFVADYTARVYGRVYFPFFLLLLALISRAQFFDRWAWPTSLKAIVLLFFVIVTICVAAVRRAAGGVRRAAIKEIEQELYDVASEPQYRRLKDLLKEIKAINTGAYDSWFHSPSFVGPFVSIGGAGLFALLKNLLG